MKIAFYPAQSGKIWTGDALETGPLGGSETAVVYLARELAARGHDVLVFTRGKSGIYHDVAYVPFRDAKSILYTTPLDVLVASRDQLPLLWPRRAAISLLWLHDLPQNQLLDADLYACVSFWQAQVYLANNLFPKEKAVVIPNGVDLSLFPAPVTIRHFSRDDAVRLVWTSNPERGLWHAEQVLRLVQREYPHATLHVYGRNDVYGWNTGYEHAFYPANMDDIVLHAPLPKAELARELAQMDLWVYPTWWPETYSIAAVEAQAAGLPVVASGFGALNETAQSGLLVPGRAADPGHVERVAEEVIRLLQQPEERQQLQRTELAFARTQTWTHSAQQFEQVMMKKLGMVA